MFTVTVKLPLEKLAIVRERYQNLAYADGPLDAVGQYVAGPGMSAVFGSAGYGSWAAVLRGGAPLVDTGALAGGFVSSMGSDGRSVLIENTGRSKMIQWVQNFGMTIHAVNVKYLRFRIGDQWVSKAQVTIPARAFFIWFQELRDQAVAIATDRLTQPLRELVS